MSAQHGDSAMRARSRAAAENGDLGRTPIAQERNQPGGRIHAAQNAGRDWPGGHRRDDRDGGLRRILAPYDPYETSFLDQLEPPSWSHWLGTDAFGRDVLSRLIYGARTALKIDGAALVGSSVGALLGVISAYFGGKVDLFLERVMDVLISFPLLVLALAVVSALGNNDVTVIVAITIPIIPRVARVIRASALSIRQSMFVEAARCIGANHHRIVLRHMLPNVMAPFLILVTAFCQGDVVGGGADLSGLGVAEPTPAWGSCCAEQACSSSSAPHGWRSRQAWR